MEQIKFSHKKIWLDSMIGMSWGFFSTLIVGTIIGLMGIWSDNNIFVDVKKMLTFLTGFGIGVGVSVKYGHNALRTMAIAISAFIASQSTLIVTYNGSFDWTGHVGINNVLSKPGDVFSAWIISVMWLYFFELTKFETKFDLFILPIVGALVGVGASLTITYFTSMIISFFSWLVDISVNENRILGTILAPVIGALMGLALTLPISSAAIALAIGLSGNAGIAALAGTSAQMISFGVITFMGTKSIGQSLGVAFGTSMLQIKNYTKKPVLLLIPSIVSALVALVAVAIFWDKVGYEAHQVTTGMGTSALYGQIYTFMETSWASVNSWMNVIFMQLLLPIVLTLPLWMLFDKQEWIKGEWLQIWENIPQDTLKRLE